MPGPSVEPLEERTLLAVATFSNGLLTVDAHATADETISISAVAGNAKVNGADPSTGAVAASQVQGIVFNGGTGANVYDLTPVQVLQVFTGLTSVTAAGGSGSDAIVLHTQSSFNDSVAITSTTITMTLNVGSGPTVNISYSSLEALAVYTGGGADTITVTEPTSGSVPAWINLFTQDETDVVELHLAPNGNGNAYGVDTGAGANDRLTVHTHNTGADVAIINQSQVQAQLSGGNWKNTTYTSVEYLQVITDAGNDTITSTEPATGAFPSLVSLESQGGDDLVTVNLVQAAAATTHAAILGSDTSDILVVNVASGHADIAEIYQGSVRAKLGPNAASNPEKVVVTSGVDILAVLTAGGNDTLTVQEPASGTIAPLVNLFLQDENDVVEINLAANGTASSYNVDFGGGTNDLLAYFTRSSGADTVTFADGQVQALLPGQSAKTAAFTGVDYLQLWSGAGDDQFTITEPASGAIPGLVLTEAESGNDTVTINLALPTVATQYVASLGTGATDRLLVHTNSSADDSVTATYNSVKPRLGASNPEKTVTHWGVDTLTVTTGGGADTISVTESATEGFPPVTSLETGDGDDSISITLQLASSGITFGAVMGTGANDRLEVRTLGGQNDIAALRDVAVEVQLGPNPASNPQKAVNVSGVDSLNLFTAGGHDLITSTATVPTIVYGGDDNDTILGGSGNDSLFGEEGADVIVGGRGNDTLDGGAARDLLFGGEGSDSLLGGDGEDILLASPSIFDANVAALAELQQEWIRTDVDRATRIAHLHYASGGLNDGVFLKVAPDDAASSNQGQTVYNDPATGDALTGGADLDWFLRYDGTLVDFGESETITNVAASTVAPLSATNEGVDYGGADNSGTFEPPGPNIAVGLTHVLTVVKRVVRWESKSFGSESSTNLASFFSALSPSGELANAKALYDQYNHRYIVVAHEPSTVDNGRILLAVSDDGDPNGTWRLRAISTSGAFGAGTTFLHDIAVGVGVDALYVTAVSETASRLWIVKKNPVFDGGTAENDIRVFNPSSAAGLSNQAAYLQPASTFGTPPSGVGTFLLASREFVSGAPQNYRTNNHDALLVIRVDNPLSSTPTFSSQLVDLGNDIDPNNTTFLPNAGQKDSGESIGMGDNRVRSALWRDGYLWAANAIDPVGTSQEGQATVRWYRISTASLGALSLSEMGQVDGEDIATGAGTAYPSLAVDALGNMAIGFTASAAGTGGAGVYPGAYYAFRLASDTAGTVRTAGLLAGGVGSYNKSGVGSWGPYSGIALDPTSPTTFSQFWVFNEYALTPGSGSNGGRWATRAGTFVIDV